jgi:uncharacterized membrane protein
MNVATNTAKTVLVASSVLGALALAAADAQAQNASQSAPQSSEKCYGVAKAGKNDCAAGAHSCAGQSTKDFDKASYLLLPKGVCAKLAGGSLTPGQ